MPFDINQFTQNGLIYGGARPSKFDVQATLPPNIQGIDPTAVTKLNFSCKAASIPAHSIGEVEIPYFGRKIKSAGDRVWEDWRISVFLDEDYSTRALFEAWMNQINTAESNIMGSNFAGEGYKSTWTLTHYGKATTAQPIRQYQLIGAWPRAISDIELDWDGTNKIITFGAVIPYDNMIPLLETTPISSSTTYAGQVDQIF